MNYWLFILLIISMRKYLAPKAEVYLVEIETSIAAGSSAKVSPFEAQEHTLQQSWSQESIAEEIDW